MKKFTRKIDYTLSIIVNVSPILDNIAASIQIHHPKSVKKKYLMEEQALANYQAVIDTVYNAIISNGMKVIKEYQSNKSYSYYIVFKTPSFLDKDPINVMIEFRISNHGDIYKGNLRNSDNYEELQIVDFVLGSKKYPGGYSLCEAIRRICRELAKGNYDILDEYV